MGEGGYCIAGKELRKDGSLGKWIRPVSSEEKLRIDKDTIKNLPKSNGQPDLLVKYLKIPFHKYVPDEHQIENHQIVSNKKWEHLESSSIKYKPSRRDAIDEPNLLWRINDSIIYNEIDNDKIPEISMENINSSLFLIKVKEQIRVSVKREKGKIQKWACFLYNNESYRLIITDVQLKNNCQDDETLPKDTWLCVSLPKAIPKVDAYKLTAEAIHRITDISVGESYAYKLVAGVITPKMYRR